ncbi:hypothetical protein GH714_017514 [Hevea brasiliensis]|uniref:Tyrosinase copper-binding domain-containing protein n=1 Tax=Hevea brasiliensis TaxID=3981 RepID=A0A6A6LPK9_HEVBR|nr:hypothetical protein GH714_017514 [Hevea brasiliensis]
MDSFSPSTNATLSTISTSSLFCRSFPNTAQLSITKKPNHRYVARVISCKATNDDHQNSTTRRDVLIGLGGFYGATTIGDPFAFAKPISAPYLTKCGKADLPASAKPTNCCPPPSTKILDFKLPSPNSPLRIRPAAHLVDDAYIAKYSKAIELMKALPDDDPRSFKQQANVHCAYCDGKWFLNGKTAKLFLGSSYRAGDEPDPGAGSIENIPHGPVHIWTGDNTQPNLEDMGNFYSAGRDPIFFAHHSNVDRMWTIWKTLGGKRTEFTDPDWLDATFLFYDENANLVRVKVRDCIDYKKLGYVYQEVDIPWLKSKPTPRRLIKKVAKVFHHHGQVAQAAETQNLTPINSFPLVLDKVISTMVRRPKKSRSKKEKEEEEEILVINGIEFERDAVVKFDVYVNDEHDSPSGPDKSEFAGSFVNVPHVHKHGKKMKTYLRLGITDLLEDLGAEDDDSVVVTLVPRNGKGHVRIGGIKIEFAQD